MLEGVRGRLGGSQRRHGLPTLHVRPRSEARSEPRASLEYVSSASLPWPSRSPRALPQAKLCTMERLLPQKMAAQCGMGRMHVLTRHVRATGHSSRGPSLVCDLTLVSDGYEAFNFGGGRTSPRGPASRHSGRRWAVPWPSACRGSPWRCESRARGEFGVRAVRYAAAPVRSAGRGGRVGSRAATSWFWLARLSKTRCAVVPGSAHCSLLRA
jgi:hypothetical protein